MNVRITCLYSDLYLRNVCPWLINVSVIQKIPILINELKEKVKTVLIQHNYTAKLYAVPNKFAFLFSHNFLSVCRLGLHI